jgi:hypothetical protein
MMIRRTLAAMIASTFTLAAVIVSAPTASAAANYCTYNVSTESGKCFHSEQQLLDYNSAIDQIAYITVFNWINYNAGAGYKTIGGASVCTATYDNEGKQLPNLALLRYVMPDGSTGATLDNSISSVETYNQCDVKFFDGTNYTGASSSWIDHSLHTGDYGFYDRASSLKIS